MKKTILSAVAVLLVAASAVQAQNVNKSALLSKIEKSDAEVADAKKNGKAVTWMTRGKNYYDAVTTPTKKLYLDGPAISSALLPTLIGSAGQQGTETIGNVTYETYTYPYFVAYFQNDKLVAWKETTPVVENGVAKAFESYSKAYDLDLKLAPKVKEGVEQLINYCLQLGTNSYKTRDFAKAGEAFAQAYDMGLHPAVNLADPLWLHNAGQAMTVDGTEHPESFVKGAEYLNRALEAGYCDEEGDLYFYLFHCYYGQREGNRDMLLKAKDVALEGIEKFPKNDQILNSLVQIYTTEEGVGDPNDLIALFDNALAANPDNIDLWFGRGRTFFAMKNYDEAIASFQKVAALKPDLYEGHYYLGIFYIYKGDAANQAFNEKVFTNQAAYDNALKEVNAIYMEALAPLEQALVVKPNDYDAVNSLKQLCFRLRDEEGMMEKYEKYNALLNELKQ